MAGSRALVGMAAVLWVLVSGCDPGGQDGTVDTELDLLVWVRASGSDATWTSPLDTRSRYGGAGARA